MKKLTSVFVLCGILLGSFFAQEANDAVWKNLVTIHTDNTTTGNYNSHKRLIFTEVSGESEDSDVRPVSEIQFADYLNLLSENRNIKNTLKVFFPHFESTINLKNDLSIFLKNRSFII